VASEAIQIESLTENSSVPASGSARDLIGTRNNELRNGVESDWQGTLIFYDEFLPRGKDAWAFREESERKPEASL
jgi:hypothetical protein